MRRIKVINFVRLDSADPIFFREFLRSDTTIRHRQGIHEHFFFHFFQFHHRGAILSPFIGHGEHHRFIKCAKHGLIDRREHEYGNAIFLCHGCEYLLADAERCFFKVRLLRGFFERKGKFSDFGGFHNKARFLM